LWWWSLGACRQDKANHAYADALENEEIESLANYGYEVRQGDPSGEGEGEGEGCNGLQPEEMLFHHVSDSLCMLV
jgi:hypothetical protein